ncbi:MAG: XkdX family protein [Clostridia bacterium]|nr:XkdX family protein [Clostridia bacterium]
MAKAKTNTHSVFYELVREKYESGAWTALALQALVSAGRITQAEYDEIVGISEE